jgi:UDPglucose 6-dehydrogenase
MKIGVVGAGYVGLVAGTCLSEMGNTVIIADISEKAIETLKRGEAHYYEPGIEELLERNLREGRLSFTTSTAAMVRDSKVIFLAVGTPQGDDGCADLSYIDKAARDVAEAMEGPKTVIIKSTVPVGTNRRVEKIFAEYAAHPVEVISNPEFLKEGAAVEDFMRPDRIVVGVRSEKAADLMRHIYSPFMRTGDRLMVMDPESAEMTKYAANAMLAARISLMNEIAKICQAVGADVNHVRRGVGSDQRIGSKFLFPGLGYGGSCFPKDIRALSHLAELHGVPPLICRAVDGVNDAQRYFFLPLLEKEFGEDLKGRTFGVWGLSFKPRTDDVREAPAIDLIRELCTRGAKVKGFDPESRETAGAAFRRLGLEVELVERQYEAVKGADALLICTEWSEFRSTDFDLLREAMRGRTIYDGRNLYEPRDVAEEGFAYHCIGRPFVKPAKK